MGQSWSRKWLCSLMMNQFSQLGSTVYSLPVWWSDLMLPSGTHGHIVSATQCEENRKEDRTTKIRSRDKEMMLMFRWTDECLFPLNVSRHRTSTRRGLQRITATAWFCVQKYPQTTTERVVDRTCHRSCPVRTVLHWQCYSNKSMQVLLWTFTWSIKVLGWIWSYSQVSLA